MDRCNVFCYFGWILCAFRRGKRGTTKFEAPAMFWQHHSPLCSSFLLSTPSVYLIACLSPLPVVLSTRQCSHILVVFFIVRPPTLTHPPPSLLPSHKPNPRQAYAELQKRNDETAKLKAELNEARAPAAEAGSAGGAVIHRRVTAMGLKPVSPGPAVAAAGAGGAEATPSRGARYAMDEGEEDSNGGAADRAEQGESGGEEEGEGEGDDDNDEEEEEEEDGKKSSGFFGWLTGSAKKRRRGE